MQLSKMIVKSISAILLLLALVISFIGCNQNRQNNTIPIHEKSNSTEEDLQSAGNLLNGVSRAVCYSGFRSSQHPDRDDGAVNPSYEEVLEDLRILSDDAGFELIRIYDCGENSEMTLKVIRENDIEMKVMLGIWLRAELSNHETCLWLTEPIPEIELLKNKKLNLLEIERGIQLANEYQDVIIAVNVGNEALVDWNDHKVATDTIISYVEKVKNSIDQEVTVADNYKWWADHGEELAKTVDFVSIHIYPVWEGKDIHEGLSYSIENFMEVQNALPHKRIVITEAGWPSIATEFGDITNEENQKRYYDEWTKWSEEMNITTFWFEAFDEDWKGNPDNPLGAEKHWGLFNIDRAPKKVMEQMYSQEL